jgi:hypothetical protein
MAGPTASISLSNNGSTNSLSLSWSVSWNSGIATTSTVSYPGGSSSANTGSITVSGLSAGTTYSASIFAEAYYSTFGERLSYTASSSATTSSPPPPPVATAPSFTVSNPVGIVGIAYSGSATASPRTSGYSISINSGSLSGMGISFDTSTGAFSGTVTAAGTANVTIGATNAPGGYQSSSSSTTFDISSFNRLKVWDGATFAYRTAVKIWNGTSFVNATAVKANLTAGSTPTWETIL